MLTRTTATPLLGPQPQLAKSVQHRLRSSTAAPATESSKPSDVQTGTAASSAAPAGANRLGFMAAFGGGAKKPLVFIPPSVHKDKSQAAAPAGIIPTHLVKGAAVLPENRFPWQQGFGQPQPRRDAEPEAGEAEGSAASSSSPAVSTEDYGPLRSGRGKEASIARQDRYAPTTNLTDLYDDNDRMSAKNKAQKRKEMRRRQAIQQRKARGGETIALPEQISARSLSNLLGVSALEVLKTCIKMGHDTILTADDILPQEAADLVAEEFGFKADRNHSLDAASQAVQRLSSVNRRREKIDALAAEKFGLVRRPPVVCIMGHVDHGKTSLLDALRGSAIAATEAGGITQHIRSFVVSMPSGEKITFLDTPGHMAFLDMRSRGARITDMVVLVIAADDGIREQTVESINLIKKSGAKMIVAINKIDKANADVERIKRDLLAYEVVLEDNGGDVQCVEISATKRLGLEELEQAVVLQADDMGLYAEAQGGDAVLLESYKDPRHGAIMVALVKNGAIRVGDHFVAGVSHGRIRMILDSDGNEMQEAGPAMPVRLVGSRALPDPGESLIIVESETVAKQVASKQQAERADSPEMRESQQKAIEAQLAQKKLALQRLIAAQEGEQVDDPKEAERLAAQEEARRAAQEREFRMIVKGDMTGSLDAVAKLVSEIPQEEVRASIIKSSTGILSEADVEFAHSVGASVLGFNMTVPSKSRLLAEKKGVPLHNFDIVYELLEHVRTEMAKMLPRKKLVTNTGEAEVLQLFSIKVPGKKVTVAGCRVKDGSLLRKNKVQVLRKGEVVYDGPIDTLKHFKDDVAEVKNGMECGIAFDRFQDVQPGDVIRGYTISFEVRTLPEQRRTDAPRVFDQGAQQQQ